jgi:hypothetical protein
VRKVLMQAPKNGFFYVLDRATGELISAAPYTEITWATGIDMKTGRPVETPIARYAKVEMIKPGPFGGHNWQPMSFNPQTGLVYIPALDAAFGYADEAGFKPAPGGWNLGIDLAMALGAPGTVVKPPVGFLLAWDPVAQKERWRVPHANMWNGGTLTTGGNLVFQGNGDGQFAAYRADTGARVWQMPVGSPIIAAPITYELDNTQYVAVMAGYGGAMRVVAPAPARRRSRQRPPLRWQGPRRSQCPLPLPTRSCSAQSPTRDAVRCVTAPKRRRAGSRPISGIHSQRRSIATTRSFWVERCRRTACRRSKGRSTMLNWPPSRRTC